MSESNQRTIVYANTIDWDFKGLTQRPHHLLYLLSQKGYKVYYVDQTVRTDKVRTRISENFEVYHNWDVFKKRVPECDVYFFSWAARYVDLQEIEADMVLYDSLDAFPVHDHLEPMALSVADVVLAASEPLYKLRKQQHNDVYLCKNACFSEHGQQQYSIPTDLSQFKQSGKPIVLFSGALAYWCDLELIREIAKQYQLVVVGRPWAVEMPQGVHYLGAKSHDELQAYYAHCDVSILPFLRGQIADYSSPIKNFEAMAHGKPTVATDIPEAVAYPDVILSSRNHDEFMQNIESALELSKSELFQEKAKLLASKNTWHHRVGLIDELIKDFFSKNEQQEAINK